MLRNAIAATLFALGAGLAVAQAAPAHEPSRGELLYTTHCVTCHSSQVHWRGKKAVTDWISLRAEVRCWQAAALLGWSEADIAEVARYLDARYYRFAALG